MKRFAKQGFTLVEIMIVVAIIALLAAIAIPNVLRGRTTANESAAIGNLRAIVSSLEMNRSVNQSYPSGTTWQATMYGADCAVTTLPNPDFGPPSFCPGALAGMIAGTPFAIQGYNYQYLGAAAPAQTYTVFATPTNLGQTGTRAFRVDESGLIRHCTCAAGTCTVAAPTVTAASLTIDQVPNNPCP